jgi:hypothetical protein
MAILYLGPEGINSRQYDKKKVQKRHVNHNTAYRETCIELIFSL